MPKVETSLYPWGDQLNYTNQNYVSKSIGINTTNQNNKIIRFKRDLQQISTDNTSKSRRIVKKLIRVEPIYNQTIDTSHLNYFNKNDYLNLTTNQNIDNDDPYIGESSNIPPRNFHRKRVIKKKRKQSLTNSSIEPTAQNSNKKRRVIITRKRIATVNPTENYDIIPSDFNGVYDKSEIINKIIPTRRTRIKKIKHTLRINPISEEIGYIENDNVINTSTEGIISKSKDDIENNLKISEEEDDDDNDDDYLTEEPEKEVIQNLYDYEPFFPELSETFDSPILLLKTTVLSSVEYHTQTVLQSKLRTYTFVVTRVNGNEQVVTSTTEVKPHTKTIVVTEPLTRYTTLTLLDLDATETLPLLPMTDTPSADSSTQPDIQEDRGRGFDEARYNLATRVMSNGVEVIVAGDKSTLPGNPDVKRVLPSSIYKPITLRPSTLTNNMMMMIPQEASKIESLSSSLYPNQFVTKTCLTTFTYLTTYLENGTTTVSSHEQVVSNVATEERNTGKILPTPTMGITLTEYPNLAVGTFLTTYTYLNTILDGEQPLVVTSKRIVTNTVTAPDDYLSLFQPNANASAAKDTNTYFSTLSLEKTLYEGTESKVISTNEIVTQVVITESIPPQGTSIMTSYIALDFDDDNARSEYSTTDVVKTYFVTYTYLNTVVDGDNTIINTNISMSSDLVTEKLFLHPNRKNGGKNETKNIINTSPIVKDTKKRNKLEVEMANLNIFATKTYLTTYTYFTTLLQEGSSTVVSSRSHLVENIVTETIEPSLLDKKYLNSLKKEIKEGSNSIVKLATLIDGQKIEITAVSKEKSIKPTKVIPIEKTVLPQIIENTVQQIEPSSNPNVVTGSTIIFVDDNDDPFAVTTQKSTPSLSKKSLTKTQSKNALNSLLSSEIVKKPNRGVGVSKRKQSSKQSLNKIATKSSTPTILATKPTIAAQSAVKPIQNKVNFENKKKPVNKLAAETSPVSNLLSSINMNNLQKLAPVFNAMAGLIQTNLKSNRRNDSTTTPKIILEKEIPAIDVQNRSPIYIPVGGLADIETAESQNIINEAYLWKEGKIESNTDHVIVGNPIHASPLINGGIPISPGEVITTNSDVIVGKPGRIGPRIPSIPINNPSLATINPGIPLGMKPPPIPTKTWSNDLNDNTNANSRVIHAPNKDDYIGPPPPQIARPPNGIRIDKHKGNDYKHIPINSFKQEPNRVLVHSRIRNHNKNQDTHKNKNNFQQQSIPINNQYKNSDLNFDAPNKQEHRPVRNNDGDRFEYYPNDNFASGSNDELILATRSNFINLQPSLLHNEHLGNPEVVERSTGQPLLVHIQPSQVAFVNIPHNRTTALIYGGSTEPHHNGQYFDDPSPYPEPEFSAIESYNNNGLPKFASVYNANGNNQQVGGVIKVGSINEPINNNPLVPIGIAPYSMKIRPTKSNIKLINGVHVDSHVNNHDINMHVPPISFGMVQQGNDFNAHIINHDVSHYAPSQVSYNLIKGNDQRFGVSEPEANLHIPQQRPHQTNNQPEREIPGNNQFNTNKRPLGNDQRFGVTEAEGNLHFSQQRPHQTNDQPKIAIPGNNQFNTNKRPLENDLRFGINEPERNLHIAQQRPHQTNNQPEREISGNNQFNTNKRPLGNDQRFVVNEPERNVHIPLQRTHQKNNNEPERELSGNNQHNTNKRPLGNDQRFGVFETEGNVNAPQQRPHQINNNQPERDISGNNQHNTNKRPLGNDQRFGVSGTELNLNAPQQRPQQINNNQPERDITGNNQYNTNKRPSGNDQRFGVSETEGNVNSPQQRPHQINNNQPERDISGNNQYNTNRPLGNNQFNVEKLHPINQFVATDNKKYQEPQHSRPSKPQSRPNSPTNNRNNRPHRVRPEQSGEISEFMTPPLIVSEDHYPIRNPTSNRPNTFKYSEVKPDNVHFDNKFQHQLNTYLVQPDPPIRNNEHIPISIGSYDLSGEQNYPDIGDHKDDDIANEAGEVIQESNSRPLVPGQVPIEVLRATTSPPRPVYTPTPYPIKNHGHDYIPHENEILSYKPNIKQPRPFDGPIVRPENQQSNQINHQESNLIVQSGSPNVFANVFNYNKQQNIQTLTTTERNDHFDYKKKLNALTYPPSSINRIKITTIPTSTEKITTNRPRDNRPKITSLPINTNQITTPGIINNVIDSQTEEPFNKAFTKTHGQQNIKTTNSLFNFDAHDFTIPKGIRRLPTTKKPITTTKPYLELNIGEIQKINTRFINVTNAPLDIEVLRPPPLATIEGLEAPIKTPDFNLHPPKPESSVINQMPATKKPYHVLIAEDIRVTTEVIGMSPPPATTHINKNPIYSMEIDIPKNQIQTTNYIFELPATTESGHIRKHISRRPGTRRTTTSTSPVNTTTKKISYWQRPVNYSEIQRNKTKPVPTITLEEPKPTIDVIVKNTDLDSQETGLPTNSFKNNLHIFGSESNKIYNHTTTEIETPILATGTVETVELELPNRITTIATVGQSNETKQLEPSSTHRRRVVTSIFKRPINRESVSKVILPTRYITHTKTSTVTITKTTVVKSLGGPPSTMTILVTKTEKSTIVDTVTEFHTLVKPTTIAETITTTIKPTLAINSESTHHQSYPIKPTNVVPIFIEPTIVIDGTTNEDEEDDELEDFIIHDGDDETNEESNQEINHESNHHHENESFFVVMTDENTGSVIKIPKIEKDTNSHETQHRDEIINNNEVNRVLLGGILIASPPILQTKVLTEQSSKCTPECKASRNELCQKVDGLMRCVCRPGFARMFPDRPCKPTYTYTMKIALERNGKDMLRYDDALSDTSTSEYVKLSAATHEALDRMVMQSDFRDIYHGVSVHGYEPVEDLDGLVNTFNLQLSDNTDESRLKEVFKKYLRNNNYSLGGTEMFASKKILERLEAKDFNECSNAQYHDCSEHAQCFNLRGTYTCSCKEGFADLSENILYPGRICSAELIGCEKCHYHGTCYSRGDEQIICECFQWYAGENCQVNLKVLLIALVTLGAILFTLLLICIIVTCARRKPQSNITNGMGFLPQRVPTASNRREGTLDRRAMIQDTSSESGNSDTNTLPYVAKKIKKSKGALKKTAHMDLENGTLSYSDQKDRSLTVMIPRAKYHPAPQASAHNMSSAQNMSSFDKRKTSIASTNEAKLLCYLDAGPSPNKEQRKYSKTDSYHEGHNPRKTSGALVSAGFEVSATVCANNMGTLATTCGTEADRSENATLIQKISASDLLSCAGTQSQFNTMRQSISYDTDRDPMDNWLDISPRIQAISESRSFDETTIQPPMKTFRNDYDSKSSQHHHEEANTMAERDLGSTFLLPHTHLYKPDRGSDISGFESL